LILILLVIGTGTAAAFGLGIEKAWGFIPILGIWIVGGAAFLGLGALELRKRRVRQRRP
jgi:hypothetical protein